MPLGTVRKLVHLTSQSSRLENAALIPTRSSVGYGFIESENRHLYFDADAVECPFDQFQVGQAVEFSADPQFPLATRVRPFPPAASGQEEPSQANGPVKAAAIIAPPGKRAPPARPPGPATRAGTSAPAPRARKPTAEETEFRVEAKTQCLFVTRYQKSASGEWRRVGRTPQIETYSSDISEKYREPQLTLITPTRAAIRVYDGRAVDLSRVMDVLGDFANAQARCDRRLLEQFPGDRIAEELSPLPSW